MKCELCQKDYTSLNSLRTHQQYYCGKEAQYKCSFCGYKSIRMSNVKRHVLNIHHSVKKLFTEL